MNTRYLINTFKNHFESKTGTKIDFRKHQFLENQYGASPCFDYNFAKMVVLELYQWAQCFIEENNENFPHFDGWEYNLSMSIEQLRTTKVKSLIETVCQDLFINYI